MINKQKIKNIKKALNSLEGLEDYKIKILSKHLIERHTQLNSNYKDLEKDLYLGFALVLESIKRNLKMNPYDVQILGALELNDGKVAEIKTGEGKTLTAVISAYFNALNTNKKVYIVTVNEYLVKRDYETMKPVFNFLGISVGYITSQMGFDEKKENYDKNIIYITNSELGFDYLRDNMSSSKDKIVQKGLDYCIIDEADSVLIDDAKTPLIISNSTNRVKSVIYKANLIYPLLKRGEIIQRYNSSTNDPIYSGDYIIDIENNMVFLTDDGIKNVEDIFKIDNLGNRKYSYIKNAINNMLVARCLLHKDKDYIVKNGEIALIDEFTGRVLDGRKYSYGLHEAIEAKENLKISKYSETLSSITYPDLFDLFEKKSAMTGTAFSSKKEFKELYNMNVIKIPTNKPIQRVDLKDKVFNTKKDKFEAVLKEIKESYNKKQPVLVGTANIKSSEKISSMLKKAGIPHKLLNAKNDKEEAEIIAKSGELSSITIATNMAGRGTDIKVSEESLKRGGLYVIGTERHSSKRIDNQLRGRSGRQGDIGKSRFFVSLEDDLIIKSTFKIPKNSLKNKNLIDSAQKMTEINNYGYRKNNQKYSSIDNKIRDDIFHIRFNILYSNSIKELEKLICKYRLKNISLNKEDSFLENKNKCLDFIDDCIKDIIQYEEYLKQFIGFYGYAQKKPHFIYAQKLNDYYNKLLFDKR